MPVMLIIFNSLYRRFKECHKGCSPGTPLNGTPYQFCVTGHEFVRLPQNLTDSGLMFPVQTHSDTVPSWRMLFCLRDF